MSGGTAPSAPRPAPGRIRVGMSGFSYPAWKGVFYPERITPADMLSVYATRFSTVEINATYRRMPTPDLIARWRDAVDGDFTFALKANQRITHFRRLRDTADLLEEFLGCAEVLGPRRGPILFQVHPTMKQDLDAVDAFFAALPAAGAYAFEPRKEAFLTDGFLALLERHGVALALNDGVFTPGSYPVTAGFAYLRLRLARYSPWIIAERRRVVLDLAARGIDVYVFFMHEDDPRAALQALRFQELVGAAPDR